MAILNQRYVKIIISCSILLLQAYAASAQITREKFNEAIFKVSGKMPDPEIFDYITETSFRLRHKNYLAMFLAHIMYETKNLTILEDLRVLENNKCQEDYHEEGIGVAGKSYHGRGYLMLTWAGNYKAASEVFFRNDTLLKEPQLLVKDKKLAMQVSDWYWVTFVYPVLKNFDTRHFGYTTKVISNMRGYYECEPNTPENFKAIERYKIYQIISKIFGVTTNVCNKGCYN